jgi:hypothetical protein
VDPHLRTPYVYQYNLSVQQQTFGKMIAQVAYVGSSSHKLTSLVDVNPFILGTQTRVFNAQPNATPQTQFNFLREFGNVGRGGYNSLQASLTKQANDNKFGTLYYTLGYTFSKSLDNASGFLSGTSIVPFYQPDYFHAVSDFDVAHRLTLSGGWDLPFDRAWSSGPRRLVKGWSLYPIFEWRTGFPNDLYANYSDRLGRPGSSGAGDAELTRLNLVGNSVKTFDPHATTDPVTNGAVYFSPSNFSRPSLAVVGNYGTLPRNAVWGPGRTNLDLALAKTTTLVRDRVALELRMEAFNALNHTQFAHPRVSFGSPVFGEITTTTIGTGPTAIHTERIIQFAARLKF